MDKIEVIKQISKNGSLNDFLEYRDDETIVAVAVTYNPNSLRYASDRLRDNEQIVTTAVESDGTTLCYASDRLKANKEIVLIAVSNAGRAIQFASDDLKDDKEVVLAALEHKTKYMCASDAFKYASDRLKDDDEVVDMAVSRYGYDALEYASEREQFNSKKIKRWLDLELRNSICEHVLVEIIMNALRIANEARGYIQKETIEEEPQKVLSRIPNKSDYNS